MIELIKECFIHFDLLGFKESDIIQINEMVFETNEFGRFKSKVGGYEFLSDKMGIYSDIDKLYIDNPIVKPNMKGLKLIRIDFKFISYMKSSSKSELIENYFNQFVSQLEDSYSTLNDLLLDKGFDIRFENPLVDIKPDDCIHTIRRNNFEFLVEYSVFILGDKVLNRYKKK